MRFTADIHCLYALLSQSSPGIGDLVHKLIVIILGADLFIWDVGLVLEAAVASPDARQALPAASSAAVAAVARTVLAFAEAQVGLRSRSILSLCWRQHIVHMWQSTDVWQSIAWRSLLWGTSSWPTG